MPLSPSTYDGMSSRSVRTPALMVSLLLTVHASWMKNPRLFTCTSPIVPNCRYE
jgi:hypothetical protein